MIYLSQLRVGERLGVGGEGNVWFAMVPSGVRFVLKIIETREGVNTQLLNERLKAFYPDLSNGAVAQVLERCPLRELQPQLRQTLKLGRADGVALLMPFLDGESLGMITDGRPLEPLQVAVLLAGVAAKLMKLPPGLAHGDVSADNVFITRTGEVVLLDPVLFDAPRPDDDVEALGSLGRRLLPAEHKPDQLWRLLGDLTGGTDRPGAREAARRLTELAQSLGAPAGAFDGVLAPLAAKAARPLPNLTPGEWVPERGWLQLKGFLWASLFGFGSAGLAIFLWVLTQRPSESSVTSDLGPDAGLVIGDLVGTYYDTTGRVSYPGEIVHVLKYGEKAAHDDGILEATVTSDQPRVALYTSRGELLWEQLKPLAGTRFLLDVKPGSYEIEIDRQLPQGIQIDKKHVDVDVLHPFRFSITTGISAP